jgi:hypothetical protein
MYVYGSIVGLSLVVCVVSTASYRIGVRHRLKTEPSFQTLLPELLTDHHQGTPEAVALVVNSPGGSPVQSNLITQKIHELATKTKIPVLAFAEDVAASGGYW